MVELTDSAQRLAQQRERHQRILRNLPRERWAADAFAAVALPQLVSPLDTEQWLRDCIDEQLLAHDLVEFLDAFIATRVANELASAVVPVLQATPVTNLTTDQQDLRTRTIDVVLEQRPERASDLNTRDVGSVLLPLVGLMQLADLLATGVRGGT